MNKFKDFLLIVQTWIIVQLFASILRIAACLTYIEVDTGKISQAISESKNKESILRHYLCCFFVTVHRMYFFCKWKFTTWIMKNVPVLYRKNWSLGAEIRKRNTSL